MSAPNSNLAENINSFVEEAGKYLRVKPSICKEAYAAACGFSTHAALNAYLKSNPQWMPELLDKAQFSERFSRLDSGSSHDGTLDALLVMLLGGRISISVNRYSDVRMQSHKYSDIAYDVKCFVTGIPLDAQNSLFNLPDFYKDGDEQYRLDSSHNFRTGSLRRKGYGQGLLSAFLKDGVWEGGFYVYGLAHIADDRRCLGTAKGALVRSILPAVLKNM